jgi:hypothetical protein
MSGYIGTQPVPQATQHREAFTATASQTSFATVGYTPQFVDVYLNGVKLAAADYTATNGSDIVLTTGAALDDILEIVAYTPFEVADQTFTGTTTTDVLTTTGAFTSLGIDDNATSTAMTLDASGNLLVGKTSSTFNNTAGIGQFPSGRIYVTRDGGNCLYLNRVTSDGDIAAFYKDGTTVGSIGSANGNTTYIGRGSTGLGFAPFSETNSSIFPFNTSTGGSRDNAIDLGFSGTRFKNAYLSGGVYLGGTGAANKLDDYEEGTWTPVIRFGGNSVGVSYSVRSGSYTKIGRIVTYYFNISLSARGSSTGNLDFVGFPFVPTNGANPPSILTGALSSTNDVQGYLSSGGLLLENRNTGTQSPLTHNNVNSNSTFYVVGVYETSA